MESIRDIRARLEEHRLRFSRENSVIPNGNAWVPENENHDIKRELYPMKIDENILPDGAVLKVINQIRKELKSPWEFSQGLYTYRMITPEKPAYSFAFLLSNPEHALAIPVDGNTSLNYDFLPTKYLNDNAELPTRWTVIGLSEYDIKSITSSLRGTNYVVGQANAGYNTLWAWQKRDRWPIHDQMLFVQPGVAYLEMEVIPIQAVLAILMKGYPYIDPEKSITFFEEDIPMLEGLLVENPVELLAIR